MGGGQLPSGTVTFLFTDIERSTETVAAMGDESYADAQEQHRKLLREAFAAHDGVEVRSEGDALFVAFSRAGEAAAAAVDGQRAVESFPWPGDVRLRVRMGLHTGEASIRDDDYVGHDVNKANRITEAGHGGQILLSESTAALLDQHRPPGVTLIDLGPHRLKDLGDRQRLFQLTVQGLQEDFPPPRSLDSFRHNLPQQRSAFVGRAHEIGVVRKLLDSHQLVTLTGIGGCGKTRLALQVAAEDLDRYPDGVFLIELAPLSEADLIPRAVAQAVGMIVGGSLTGGSPKPIEDLVVGYLERREVLLILDNCEHMLDACSELADRILDGCPAVKILATSREVLEVEGEQAWRVPSLEVSSDDSDESEAVRLFETRARAVLPTFEVSADNIATVAEICARLDGLPLAIELAASRISHLSPRQIADRLDDMFRLLTGGRRRVQRQQTMEASLDWSYELLEDAERTLHRRLAVFAGDFGLDAIEDVCSDNTVPRPTVVNVLRSLVDKSLVQPEQRDREVRYRLLEPVRLYAAEQLRQAAEADTFRTRHRDRFVDWVASFSRDDSTFGFKALRSFELEHDNLRAALEWSAGDERFDLIAKLANGVLTLWWNGGNYDEGFRWLTEVADSGADVGAEELANAYAGLTACAVMRVDDRAADFAARAVAIAGEEYPAATAIAASVDAIGSVVAAEASRDPKLIEHSRERARQAIDAGTIAGPAWEAFALVAAGQIELVLRDIPRGAILMQRAFDVWAAPSVTKVASASALSVAKHILGDNDGTLAIAVVAADAEKTWWRPGMGSNAFALALAGGGDIQAAREQLRISIEHAKNWGVDLWLNEVLVFAGAIAFLAGDAARSSSLLAAGRYLGGAREMTTPFRTGQSYALYLHYIPKIREAIGPLDARRARVRARAMSLDEAVAYALEDLDG